MGLAGEAGEAGGVALPDDLVEPGRPLDVGGVLLPQGKPHIFKIRTGIEDIAQGGDEQVRLVPDDPKQVRQQAVEVVVDLEVAPGRLVEEDPAPAAKHLDVALVVQRKALDYCIPQGPFAADPAHEAVQGASPPGCSPKFSSAASRPSTACSRPRAMISREWMVA